MKAARIGLPFFVCRACSLLLEYALGGQEAADKLENGQSGCGGSLAIQIAIALIDPGPAFHN